MKKTDNSNLDYEVNRLNKLFKLYSQSIKSKNIKPYRVSRLRCYLESLLATVKNKYEIILIDTNNFADHFTDIKEQLNLIREVKSKTIESRDYENLSVLRDKENAIVKDYLLRSGILTNIHFFYYENKIFKI